MSDALTPLRHAYGVEPAGPAPAAGEPGHVELTLLRQMRTALDALPSAAPEAATVESVLGHADPLAAVKAVYDAGAAPASAEHALLASTAETLDHTLRLGAPGPEADVVQAVLARAAEASVLAAETRLGADATATEAAVLDQSLGALDRLPVQRPDADVVARVLDHARALPLAAVRHLYADGPAPASEAGAVEAEVLRQTGQVLDRALRSRAQPRPSAEALDGVLACAAEARPDAALLTEATSPVEAAVLEQSLTALDRLPLARPEASTVGAVLAQAATATPASRPARRAPDRTPSRTARPRRRVGVWAGAGGLLVAALVAVVVLPSALSSEPDLAPEAASFAADVAASEPVQEDAAPEEVAEAEPTPPNAAPALAATAALAAAVPPVVTRSPASGPSTPPTETTVQLATAVVQGPDATDTPPAAVPSWDAGDDVRTLSLRLQEMERSGLAWDAPVEVGAPNTTSSPAATPGLQVVREGAPPPPALPDSSRQQR